MKKKTIVKEFKALFEEAQKSFNVLKFVFKNLYFKN
jgi:hypothetical protein